MAEPGAEPRVPGPSPSISVNGRLCPLPPGASLATVLAELGIGEDTPGVAVAVNDRVVPRAAWAARRLEPGDRIEVVRAVAGG